MTVKRLALACLVATFSVSGAALADGDAAKGKKNFRQCKACHDVRAGRNKVGPSLHGLIGRTAGTAAKYKYSTGLKAAGAKGLTWDEKNLFTYLKDPSAFLKEYLGKKSVKNKMKNKYKKEGFRRDVIAYLMEATK